MRTGIVALLLIAVCCPHQVRGDQDVEARFRKSLDEAKALSNIELVWLDTLCVTDPEGLKVMGVKEFTRTFQYSFLASGQKFRAMKKYVSSTKTNVVRLDESAFNGTSHASYTGDSRSMAKTSTKPPGDNSETAHNPFVGPFMFLRKYSDECPRCVLRPTDIFANEFAAKVTLPAPRKVKGGIEVSVSGQVLGKQPTTWTIALDESGDEFTPKTVTEVCPGSHYAVVHHFLSYTNLGGYQFPSKIEWTMSAYPATVPPTVLSTGAVTVLSARIPEAIADSTFTLDSEEQAAAVVWDWDQHRLTKSAPELARVTTGSKTVRNVFLLILVTTVALSPIVVRKLSSKDSGGN